MSFSQENKKIDEVKGRLVGETAPMFTALDADSNFFSLENELKKGPVVIIFYRGFWCPVCNKHLSLLQDSLLYIIEKGARVVAISPEKPEYLNKMADKTGAQFTLLYDEGYRIANAYDVTFEQSSGKILMHELVFGSDYKKSRTDDSNRLPIPATFIIDQKGKIIWRQFDPNYKKRSTVKSILDAL